MSERYFNAVNIKKIDHYRSDISHSNGAIISENYRSDVPISSIKILHWWEPSLRGKKDKKNQKLTPFSKFAEAATRGVL